MWFTKGKNIKMLDPKCQQEFHIWHIICQQTIIQQSIAMAETSTHCITFDLDL